MMPSLKDFVEAMSVGWPVALAVLVGCAAMLGADHFAVKYIEPIPDWILATVFVLGAFAAGICATQLLLAAAALVKHLKSLHDARRRRERQLRWLQTLPDRERQIMGYLFSSGTQAFAAPHEHHNLIALTQKGLVIPRPGVHSILDWPYIVPDFVWDAMQRDETRFTVDLQQVRHPFSRF